MVLLGMINVVLKLLGGSLIWKDYSFFSFPEENGIIAFKLLSKQAHQQITNNVYFPLMHVIFFFPFFFLKEGLVIKIRNDQFCLK